MRTYYDFETIQGEISRILRFSAEGESAMNAVWVLILTWQFDFRAGYVPCPQDRHSFQGGTRGFSDFHVYQRVGNTRKPILIVQCKKAGLEGSGYTWDRARAQLARYLGSIYRDPRSGPTVHGIVTIGQWVRFYDYDGTMHDMTFDIGGTRQHQFRLVEDRWVVQKRLNHIRDNH